MKSLPARASWPKRTSSLVALAFTALLIGATLSGGFHDGQIGQVGQRIRASELAEWALYASANSLGTIALVVSMSTLLGVTLGQLRRRSLVLRWLELLGALPAFVLTALWVTGSPRAPLLVLTLCVAAQRAVQIAALVARARPVKRWQPLRSPYPDVAVESPTGVQWRPLLWVAAAHSAVIFAAEHAALVLLGIIPAVPSTWLATLCAAATGAADVGIVAVGLALLGATAVPWALWSRARAEGGL